MDEKRVHQINSAGVEFSDATPEKKKRNKDKTKKSKYEKHAKESIHTCKCILRARVPNKKTIMYTEEEITTLSQAITKPKDGYPLYMAIISDDKIEFKKLRNAKKLKSISHESITQIVANASDKKYFFIYIAKSKKAKRSFAGFFAVQTDADADILYRTVRKTNPNVIPDDVIISNNENEPDLRHEKKASSVYSNNYEPKECGLASLEPSSESFSSDYKNIERFGCQTYTAYCPNRVFYQDINSRFNFHLNQRSSSSCSSDTYHCDNPDFICRDKESVFYGERMSPKSQYVDRLLRGTVRTQYQHRYI